MFNTKRIAVLIAVLLVCVLLVSVFWFFEKKQLGSGQSLSIDNAWDLNVGTTAGNKIEPGDNKSQIQDLKDSGVEFETGEVKPSIKMPELNRRVVFPADMSAKDKAQMEEKIGLVIAGLKTNSLDFDAWIQFGAYLKAIKDYSGAAEAWQYAAAIRPSDALSYGNLAELYGYYFHDNAKAEENYLKAIEVSPKSSYPYLQLFDYYHYGIGDDIKAVDILQQAMKNIPFEAASFQKTLDELNLNNK